MRRAGFTLVELLIVIAILAILAAIALPGLTRSRMGANERSASATLRAVASAEDILRNTDADGNGVGDYWTGDLSGLTFLSDNGAAGGGALKVVQDTAVAQADLAPLAAGAYDGSYHLAIPGGATQAKSGYWYVSLAAYRPAYHDWDHGFAAVPARSDRTGVFCFLVGGDGTLYAREWEPWSGETSVEAGESAKVDAVLPAYPTDGELTVDWEPVQ